MIVLDSYLVGKLSIYWLLIINECEMMIIFQGKAYGQRLLDFELQGLPDLDSLIKS